MRQHHERTEYLRLHDRARMGRRLSYGQSATQLVRTPPGLQTWNSTPASVAELPSFQPVDCSIPWRTEAIFGTPTPIPQQTTATLEDLLARHLASNADVHTTFTIPRISADQLTPVHPVHLQDDLQILQKQHPALTASFAVTSFRGRAILFSRNTFECIVGSKHLYIPDTGSADSALGTVVARGRLRGPMRGGRDHFAIMSVHINNTCASRSAICINLILMIRDLCLCESVDIMAGDFNKALCAR